MEFPILILATNLMPWYSNFFYFKHGLDFLTGEKTERTAESAEKEEERWSPGKLGERV